MKASYQLGRFWQVGLETSCCRPRQAFQLSALAQKPVPGPSAAARPPHRRAHSDHPHPQGSQLGDHEHTVCEGPQPASNLFVVWGGPYVRCLGTPV